jgi:hypothetical protein
MANNHSEVWDDSLLIHSWNEALEEYKVRMSLIGGYIINIRIALS